MRPASRRALLRSLAAVAPSRAARIWSLLALVALAGLLIAFLIGPEREPIRAVSAPEPSALVVDPVLALPFGEGRNSGVAPSAKAAPANGPIEELRVAFRTADDRQKLYGQLKQRSEPDALYLAFRAARDCALLLSGSGLADLDAISERRSERERQFVAANKRCTGFVNEPPVPEEMRHLEEEAAKAGHAAAQIALASEMFTLRSFGETLDTLRRGLASGDPLAFDEARGLLAMSRFQAEVAGVSPGAEISVRRTDPRLAALDVVNCRLDNPCGPAGRGISIDCNGDDLCERDAEQWLLDLADVGDDERRSTVALADRLLVAFKSGAVDAIVRLPVEAPLLRR